MWYFVTHLTVVPLADAVQQSLVCVLKILSCFLLSDLHVAVDER